MKILTSSQIKFCENLANENGLTAEVLMNNAGYAVYCFIKKKISDYKNKKIVVICGNGNNGGDGYVTAQKLYNDYVNVDVISTKGEPKSEHALAVKIKAQKLGLKIFNTDDIHKVSHLIEEADILIDAIFGIGFNGALPDEVKALNILWNRSKAVKFAVDVPTGVITDTGEIDKDCFKSDYTISFMSLKPANIMLPAKDYFGSVALTDIGIKKEIIDSIESEVFLIDDEIVWSIIKPKSENGNKGDYGKLLNISGCNNMMGAAALSTMGALRVGVGIVTLASTRNVILSMASKMLESKFLTLPYNNYGTLSANSLPQILNELENSSACLIGCGLGINDETKTIFKNVVKEAKCQLIIDADGLNILSENLEILKEANAKVILTPHIGEMARLLKITTEDVIKSRYEVITNFAKEYNVTVVLKDYSTTVVDEMGKMYINIYSNSGLSKGGSGDVLAGIIAGLVAQGIENAAVCGVYLHSKAAEYCASKKSKYCMLPSDLINYLCDVFLEANR